MSPVHHIMKIPLVIRDIEARTEAPEEKAVIAKVLEMKEASLSEYIVSECPDSVSLIQRSQLSVLHARTIQEHEMAVDIQYYRRQMKLTSANMEDEPFVSSNGSANMWQKLELWCACALPSLYEAEQCGGP